MHKSVVVVGAGHAAAQLCVSLAASPWDGQLSVIGDESELPYHRPPLSKHWLQFEQNKAEPTPQSIRPEAFYRKHGVQFLSDVTVTSIDRDARCLALSGAIPSLAYDTLVLATGSLHRRPPIPGIKHERVHTLRTAADATALRNRLGAAGSVAVIGAGFIGLEAAASLRQAGLQVTVLEQVNRPLARVTSPEVSGFFAALHRANGVDLRFEVAVTRILDQTDGLRLELSDSTVLDVNLVLLGAGAFANDALAADAGLVLGDPPSGGVLVDAGQQTNDPRVLAIGDCCNQANALYGGQQAHSKGPKP